MGSKPSTAFIFTGSKTMLFFCFHLTSFVLMFREQYRKEEIPLFIFHWVNGLTR